MNRTRLTLFVLILSCLFFFGIAYIDGPIWCVDSGSYASMDFSREPVYPTFLWILRTIFGENVYLFVAVILQSLLWVYVTCVATMYVYDLASELLPQDKRGGFFKLVFVLLVFFSQLLTSILNRFVAQRGSMYSESIMTESLAMPLFVLFCIRLSRWLVYKRKIDFVSLVVISFVIINTRKQMMIVLILWIAASFICTIVIKKTRSVKHFLIVLISIVAISVSSKLFDCTYNYLVRGVFHEHTGNGMGALCVMMYSADRSNADLFTDNEIFPGEKELFLKIYDECYDQEILLDNFRGTDWYSLTDHFASSYDVIGYEIVLPATFEYIKQQNPDMDYDQIRILDSEIESHMARVLMGQDKKDLLTVFLANLLRAFAYSNAKPAPAIIVAASMALYGLYVILLSIVGIKMRKNESYTEIFVFGGVSLLGLMINAGVVALLIFPQGRYMAYATGLFYSAILLLLVFCYTYFSRNTAE